ncbi:MAG TPA: DNA cytosine methyltransferase [Acidobacteriota bacterium]|nr:DNA cytosine methyltransferase [Acidobacteriota bacterium]
MTKELENLLTLSEVRMSLRISRETAYRWLKAGRLHGVKVGRDWRFSPDQVQAAIAEHSSSYGARPPLVADLFSGAGGLSLGFHLEGFQSVFFNDLDAECAFTFQQNFPGAKPIVAPIQQISARDVFVATGTGAEDLDVLVGGPPCQGFSINAPARSSSDERNHLFRHYARLVLEGIRPKFIVFENVPGLVSLDGGGTLAAVCHEFRRAGYEPYFRILNACHYGVPQERWRLVIVANRMGVHFDFPEPTHFSVSRPNFSGGRSLTYSYAARRSAAKTLFDEAVGLRDPVKVREAISDLPPIQSGGGTEVMDYASSGSSDYQQWARNGSSRLLNHHCVDLSDINRLRMQHVRPGGSWRDIPRELLPDGMKRARRSDHTRRYGRLDPDGIAFTVMTKCDPHWGTVVHYAQDRVISVREAARFQSFPDWFIFYGSKGSQYRQVGNAVPPLLARAIASKIRYYLELSSSVDLLQHRNARSLSNVATGALRI